MQQNPVGWFEIYVQDVPRARAFYERLLDIEMVPLEIPDIEMWGFPMDDGAPGTSGSIISTPDMPSGGNSVMVYFSCRDCAVEEGRAEAAGGEVLQSKMAVGDYGFVSIIKDPDGNRVGLHSRQ